jgi:hypothetical protein
MLPMKKRSALQHNHPLFITVQHLMIFIIVQNLMTVKTEWSFQGKQTINIQVKIACCYTTGMCFSEISLGLYYLGSPSENIIHCQEMIPTRNTVDAHM